MNKDNLPEEVGIGAGAIMSGNVNTGGGDFVGRDKDVFMGRDLPAQQVINISGDINDSTITIYPDTKIGRIGAQIDRLRGRVTRLIPAENALIKLAKLREPKPIGGWSLKELEVTLGGIMAVGLKPTFSKQDGNDSEITAIAQKYLYALGEIEAGIVPSIDPEKYSKSLQSLSNIADDINIRISQLSSLFTSIVYPATTSRELAKNMVAKIGHKE
ncbi:MAG: hypothetical protein ABTQ25_14130, partial [Nitrosomonas ureae]